MNNEILTDYWYKRANKELKNEDILYDFIKNNPDKTRLELLDILVNKELSIKTTIGESKRPLMSYATFHKHLKGLKAKGKILYNDENKNYSTNPNYIELSDISEEQLRLRFEEEWGKIQTLENINMLENTLWLLIHDKTKLFYNFGEGLKDKIFFSNEVQLLIGRLFNSLIRECIIMNPELWHVMNKPEHYNFSFSIECNFQEDPHIFKIIQLIKEKCIKSKEVPLFSVAPFVRKIEFDYSDINNIKLKEAKKERLKYKIDRTLKDLYYNSVGQATLFNKEMEKIEKEKQKNPQEFLYEQFKKALRNREEDYERERERLGKRKEFKQYYKENLEEWENLMNQLNEAGKGNALFILDSSKLNPEELEELKEFKKEIEKKQKNLDK